MAHYHLRAYLDSYEQIVVQVDTSLNRGVSGNFYLLWGDEITPLTIRKTEKGETYHTYYLDAQQLVIGQAYEVMGTNGYRTPLVYRFITKTERFEREFFYGGDDLGASIKNGVTTFRLWAPTAANVTLLAEDGYYQMTRGQKGVWSLSFKGSLEGARYRYLVRVNGEIHESNDPYGRAVTANNGWSIVSERRPYLRTPVELRKSLGENVVYEVSVRDYTPEGTFRAFADNLEYIASLGVSAVQLMPVNDFASVDENHRELYYNWGYDPLNYQALEGSYSSDVSSPLTVIEDFKYLVSSLHQHNLKVVLDVVFNHVYNASTSSFENCVPYYYFRYDREGNYLDGSYCGNELASELAMVRKYIIDTLRYYMYEFDVDGFRFDLMGLMDRYCINQAASALKAIKEDVLLYGEGWNMASGLAEERRACMDNYQHIRGVGFFDDRLRDTVRGANFDWGGRGYATGNLELAEATGKLMLAERFEDPERCVCYVQCHDDLTLYDKIAKCCDRESADVLERRLVLATAMTLFARGIGFIGAGQEFALSKDFIANNYNSPDSVNQLSEDKRGAKSYITEQIRELISIRKEYAGADQKASYEVLEGHLIWQVGNLEVIFNPAAAEFTYRFEGARRVLFDWQGKAEGIAAADYKLPPVTMAILEKIND